MEDNTAEARRRMMEALDLSTQVCEAIGLNHREALEASYGPDGVWDRDELVAMFEVQGFLAPMAVVKRRSDGAVGSVIFSGSPRLYFGFVEDK